MNIKMMIKRITPFFEMNQFNKKGYLFYYIKDKTAYCVEFESLNLIYCRYYILPLYIPTENRYYTYGNRMESFTKHKITPLDPSADDEAYQKWICSVQKALQLKIFPFFNKVSSADDLISVLAEEKLFKTFFCCSEYHYYKLLAYTDFVRLDAEGLKSNCDKAINSLNDVPFTSNLIDLYKSEMVELQQRMFLSPIERNAFVDSTIEHTLKNCFGVSISG